MKKSATALISFFCLVVCLTACGEIEDTHPGKPVKSRQVAFKEIIKIFEPMGVMLREKRYDANEFSNLAQQLAKVQDSPWKHFGPDTNYPPSRATPAIWDQPEKFERERQQFFQSVSALQIAASSKDLDRIIPAYKALHGNCQSCHKSFKHR